MAESSLAAFTHAIAAAAAAWRSPGGGGGATPAPPPGPPNAALLACLGFPVALAASLAGAARPADLPADLRSRLRERLGAEAARLARLGRAGSARYDLDRHMAVADALRWLGSQAPRAASPPVRPSGAALNARFRRSRPLPAAARRRPPASAAADGRARTAS